METDLSEEEAARQPFIDVPFDDAQTQIRLLKLYPGYRDDHIEGKLFVYPKSELPAFEAISYTWGDPKLSKTITLNGSPFDVALNSWTALKQVRFTNSPRLLWMDTVCIDQRNNNEKSHQVQGMESIYRGAKTVLVSLGGMGHDAGFLFEWIWRFNKDSTAMTEGRTPLSSSVLGTEGGGLGQDLDPPKREPWARPSQKWTSCLIDWYSGLGPAGFEKLFKEMVTFGNLSYWLRLWVYVEYTLSTDALVFYGSSVFPMKLWDIFISILQSEGLADFVDWKMLEDFDRLEQCYMVPSLVALREAVFRAPIALFFATVRTYRLPSPEYIRYGGNAWRDLRELECAEPLDRIFALVSRVDWQRWGLGPITVDYIRNKMDVALQCLTFSTDIADVTNLLAVLDVGCRHKDSNAATFLQLRPTIASIISQYSEHNRSGESCDCLSSAYMKYVRFQNSHPDTFGKYFIIKQVPGGQLFAGTSVLDMLATKDRCPFSNPESKDFAPKLSSDHQIILGQECSTLANQPIAVVPFNALPSDLVVLPASPVSRKDSIDGNELSAGFVLRKDTNGIYRIISHALMIRDFPDLMYTWNLDVRFAEDDALAFALRGLCTYRALPESGTSMSDLEDTAQSLLAAAPTEKPFSSYAVQKPFGETKDRTGVVCAQCGGILDECYQSVNRNIIAWPGCVG